MSFVTSPGDIAYLYKQVASNISSLTSAIQEDGQNVQQGQPENRYREEQQRLAVWAGEHGVQEGRLDYRLREASLLHERVISLLKDLQEVCVSVTEARTASETQSLSQEQATLPETRVESETLPQLRLRIDSQKEQDRAELSSVASRTSSGIDTSNSYGETIPDTPVTRIHDNISLLFELGPTLVNAVPHDRLSYTAATGASQYDLDHVQSKFPKAPVELIDRSGIANWERRQSLRNLRSKHEKGFRMLVKQQGTRTVIDDEYENHEQDYAAEVDDDDDEDSSQADTDPSQSSSGVGVEGSVRFTSRRSVVSESIFSGAGTQSTPGTELSMPHWESTPTNKYGYKLHPPPDPNRDYSGEAFLCPYCFQWLSEITSSSQWRKHVFGDLEPYMCTYEKCALANNTYGRKKDWWEHETEEHRVLKAWRCSPCQTIFDTVTSFNTHISHDHPNIKTQEQLRRIRDLCEESTGMADPHDMCPFCREYPLYEKNISPRRKRRKVRKHISRHLEELALFVAFPAGQMILKDDDPEFIDDSDSEVDMKTEIESLISDDRRPSRAEVRQANVNRFMVDQSTRKGVITPDEPDDSNELSSHDLGVVEPLFPLRILLHPPNEHFYGRDALISEAADVLSNPCSICIFHGVGGIGKTLAAVEYAHTKQDSYDAVFWLQADTAPSLSDSFAQMGMALGLVSSSDDHLRVMEAGRTWLQDTAKRWLLVFDNVISWEQISPFLPNDLQRSNGSVLMTTQHKNVVRDSENIKKLCVGPLDRKNGSEMLLKYLNKDAKRDSEKHLAEEISAFVGGLPIAIAHVAGYADESRYSLEELIEVFREWRKRTGVATDEADDLPPSLREAAISYEETLSMVWSVTLRELTKDASDVMHILAYLNSEAVPVSMLFAMHEEQSLHFLDSREKTRLRRIRESLIRRRLVQSKEVDGVWCFSVHRSLQRGIRETLAQDASKQQVVFDQTVAILREVFPRTSPLQQPMPNLWAEFQRLLPHLHALRDVYNKSKANINASVDFAQLLTDAGMDQFERGITKEGLVLLKTADEVLDAISLEENQVLRADIHAMIGIMYDNTGIETRSEGLRRRRIALDIRRGVVEKTRSPKRNDEILLYNSWMEYAISLLHYHRFEEAEPMIEDCYHKYTEWGTENKIPFEYAKYYHKIALVRMYQRKFEEAIELATRGADLMSQTGYDLFETRFRFDLACIILQSGDVDRALRAHREIFDSRLEKLGQANELTLHSRYAIGAIYEIKGQWEEAEFWFRKALGQRRGLSSWPEEAFARAQFHLAAVLMQQGDPQDVDEAKYLRDRAVEVLYRLLPLDHPAALKDCKDEAVLFDHMLSVQGARFTGRGLLKYVSVSVS